MKKILDLTPQTFVEVILLALFWEHWPPKKWRTPRGHIAIRKGWSTVDHVLKILRNLGHITDPQIKMVQHKSYGVQHQVLLRRHCGTSVGCTLLYNKESWFICQQGSKSGDALPLGPLVRNLRLELHNEQLAKEFEAKYAEIISKEEYLAEVERLDALFKTEKSSAAASSKYRARVAAALTQAED